MNAYITEDRESIKTTMYLTCTSIDKEKYRHIFVTIQMNFNLKLKKIILHSSSECCMCFIKEFFYSKHMALFDIS